MPSVEFGAHVSEHSEETWKWNCERLPDCVVISDCCARRALENSQMRLKFDSRALIGALYCAIAAVAVSPLRAGERSVEVVARRVVQNESNANGERLLSTR